MAKKALLNSRRRERVKLEDLGPATFNRGGTVTDSQHCRTLMAHILTEAAFATHLYNQGYCHEPNPKDPLMVAKHGNQMHGKDPTLPRLPETALKGVFAKTHLVTALQMFKAGLMPELSRMVEARSHDDPEEMEEFKNVLEHGLYMHVFPWHAVERDPDGFTALMSSDNFQQGVGLKESEIRCVHGMKTALGHMDFGAEPRTKGATAAKIMQHVKTHSGNRWTDRELKQIWDFANTTEELPLDLLHNIWVHGQFESKIVIDSGWLQHLSELAILQQWNRASLAVMQFMSNPDDTKETLMMTGRVIANVVRKQTLQRMKSANATEYFKTQSRECGKS